ncbi:MAG: polysaccharide pyruvyl transferase family protein [Chitinophagaceae bacterium]|nr:polysaccharide pyruvyl transferase family protein [Chitinophagaceae bacterium]
MRIIISNAVTLNGGDFAILHAMIKILKQTYGENTEIIVYDNNDSIASKYYPEIKYRKLLYFKYFKIISTNSSEILRSIKKIYNAVIWQRFIIAARLYQKGVTGVAGILLSKEQKKDFDNYTSADIIISTGGTYLVENYDLTSRYFDYDFTLALKKPLVFFTQSVGPFNNFYNQQKIKKIFNQARLILLRDEASLDNLKAIEVDVSKAKVCADVVFSEADPAILQSAKIFEIKKLIRVAISVRDWNYFKQSSQKEGMENYNDSIATLCEYVTVTLRGEVFFISTCQGISEYSKDDSKVAEKIYSTLSYEAKKNTTVDSNFHHPEQLKTLVKDFDIVISTRMHFAIQSLVMGVPVLPIAYEFKTKELFTKLINKEWIADIETINGEELIDNFKNFLSALPGIRSDLFEKVEAERQSALKPVQYLREFVNA